MNLTLVENEGRIALGHFIALLCQQEVLDHRGVVVAFFVAVIGCHKPLGPAAPLTNILKQLCEQERKTNK